jgi:hypothetical protein
MSQLWFASQELAGLPGLPASKRRILSKANREQWRHKKKPSRGRTGYTILYHISSLPEAARAQLIAQSTPASTAQLGVAAALDHRAEARLARENGIALYAQLPARQQAQADARFAVITARDHFIHHAKLPKTRGTIIFVQRIHDGQLKLDERHRAIFEKAGRLKISAASVKRWDGLFHTKGLAALASDYKGRRGSRSLTAAMQQLCIGVLVEHFNTNAEHHIRAISARHPGELLPSIHAVRRFINNWLEDNATLYQKLKNPDKFRSLYQFAIGDQSEGILRLNQRWEMDSTPADLLLADGGRYTIIGCIDIYSRRLKMHLSPTSKSLSVAALIRRCIIDWGVPEEIKTDNGADYVAHYLEHVLVSLEIGHPVCTPFEPQQKPFIERALGTFSHDLTELMPGYIGHSVADRKDIEARRSFADRMMKKGETCEMRMDAAQLQATLDKWCAIYHERQHSGLEGQRPNEIVQAWTHPVRAIQNHRALDVLLAPLAGYRTIGKKGIRVENRFYAGVELAGYEGARVLVKLDPLDLRRVFVFDLDNIFIGIALDPTAPEIDRAEFATRIRAHQTRVNNEGTKALRAAAKQMSVKEIGAEILDSEAAKLGNLARLPGASANHTAAALEQAADAVRAKDAQVSGSIPIEATEEEIAASDLILERAGEREKEAQLIEAEQASKLLEIDFPQHQRPTDAAGQPIFDSPADRYEWLLDRTINGAPLTGSEREWMQAHETKFFGKVMTT